MSTKSADFLTEWTVLDIMERDVFTVPQTLPVSELSAELLEHGITGAPVVDEAGIVVGVVSQSDIVRAVSGLAVGAAGPGYDPDASKHAFQVEKDEEGGVSAFYHRTDGDAQGGALAVSLLPAEALAMKTVEDIMMPARFSVRPSTTLAGLARYLVTARLHRALVMDAGKLLGIVTTFDILRAIAGNDVVRQPV